MGGVPLLEVSRLLGHKSITQTERYAHLAPESSRALVGVLEGKANSSSTLSTTWTEIKTADYQNDLNTSAKWSG